MSFLAMLNSPETKEMKLEQVHRAVWYQIIHSIVKSIFISPLPIPYYRFVNVKVFNRRMREQSVASLAKVAAARSEDQDQRFVKALCRLRRFVARFGLVVFRLLGLER